MKMLMRNHVLFSCSLLRRQNTDIQCIMILMGKTMILNEEDSGEEDGPDDDLDDIGI